MSTNSDNFDEDFAFTRAHVGESLNLACAVDGSRVSMKALELAFSLMRQKERGDTLTLVHVPDRTSRAPASASPAHIRSECELKCADARIDAKFVLAEPEKGGSVITAIADAAERVRADLLLVGATGLHVEQGEVHRPSFSVMGSTSDGSLRTTNVSVAVVKSTSYDVKRGGAKTFMLATDDSPAARVAFALLVTKLATPATNDAIKIFTAVGGERGEDIVAKYAAECARLGFAKCETRAECHEKRVEAGESVSDAILKAARAWEADALLLGTNAFSSKTLGSVSDGCAQEARCTTIVVKDPRV